MGSLPFGVQWLSCNKRFPVLCIFIDYLTCILHHCSTSSRNFMGGFFLTDFVPDLHIICFHTENSILFPVNGSLKWACMGLFPVNQSVTAYITVMLNETRCLRLNAWGRGKPPKPYFWPWCQSARPGITSGSRKNCGNVGEIIGSGKWSCGQSQKEFCFIKLIRSSLQQHWFLFTSSQMTSESDLLLSCILLYI